MPNCKYCGQEIIQGEFEGEIDICTDCIITSSQDYGMKFLCVSCIFFVAGAMFLVTLISLIINLPSLLVNFEEFIIYYIIPVSVCIITGSFLLGYFYISKKKKKLLMTTNIQK